MKKKIRTAVLTAILCLCTVAGIAWAEGAFVDVHPGQITATAVNNGPRVMVCNGRVFGQRADGSILFAWMSYVPVPPGQSRYVFVSTNPYADPFVNGWSDIECVFPPQR